MSHSATRARLRRPSIRAKTNGSKAEPAPSLLNPMGQQPLESSLPKAATGIRGFDEITGGGLPRGRATLVAGAAGCGKTVFGMEFIVHGARRGEPGVFVAFEETAEELAQNFQDLGFDLKDLEKKGLVFVDQIVATRHTQIETGDYDLEGLFVRLEDAIQRIGAKRIVLDTIETLFNAFENPLLLRAEFQRLFRWLKDRNVTALITAERGHGEALTRAGLEEYVADAVVLLDHRLHEGVSTRRLRIVKYRGSRHGTNEYPFLIDQEGISVLPITSAGLEHVVSRERVSSGVPTLDKMLGGKGFFRGSSILVSGTPGAGKTSLAGHFIGAACARGENVLLFAFEESPAQVFRNLESIGVELEKWQKKGNLRISAQRPTTFGLETHLSMVHHLVEKHKPTVVIVDPLTDLQPIATPSEIRSATTRIVDHLKSKGITALFSAQSIDERRPGMIEMSISSLMDTWIDLRTYEIEGERVRSLAVIKSRGMAHSREVRPLLFTKQGIVVSEGRVVPPLNRSGFVVQTGQSGARQ